MPRAGNQIRTVFLTWVLLAWLPCTAWAADITLTGVSGGEPGATIRVEVQGEVEAGDFLSVAKPDAPPTEFINYARVTEPAAIELKMPGEAGVFVVRYVSPARNLSVLAEVGVSVGVRAASLSVVPEAQAGATVAIRLSEPGDPSDFVTIVLEGADATDLGPYVRIRKQSVVELVLEIPPGEYEVRQVRAAGLEVLARAPITILPDPTRTTTDTTTAGIDGDSESPRHEQPTEAATPDALAEAIARQQEDAAKALTRMFEELATEGDASPGSADMEATMAEAMKAVEAMKSDAAEQALAMVQSSARESMGSAPREVSLIALDAVDAGRTFRIIWDGDGKPGDRIGILPVEAPGGSPTGAMIVGDTVIEVEAPEIAGHYEIVFQDALTGQPLARRKLEVR